MAISMYPQYTLALLIISKILGAVFLIPASPLTLITGAIYGVLWGTVVAMIGNTIGAVCAFLLGRYFFYDLVQKKLLPKYPKVKEYEQKLFKNGIKTMLFLRLVPIFPFNVLNYFLSVTEVTFKQYFWTTFFGILPGTIAYVYFGESIKMFSVLQISLAFALIFALSSIGKFWKV